MTMKLLRFSPLVGILTALACGDDNNGTSSPPPPFESQEEGTQVVSALTPAEQTAFCTEFVGYFDAHVSDAGLIKVGCYFLGISFAQDAASCNELAKSCISSPDSEPSNKVDCDSGRLADCTATVQELETCYTDTVTALKGLASTISCSMTPEQLSSLEDKPASCALVETKCPKLFEDEPAQGDQ